jgi:hypothetical protein
MVSGVLVSDAANPQPIHSFNPGVDRGHPISADCGHPPTGESQSRPFCSFRPDFPFGLGLISKAAIGAVRPMGVWNRGVTTTGGETCRQRRHCIVAKAWLAGRVRPGRAARQAISIAMNVTSS